MEKTKSYWLESTPATNYPTLDKDISVDVAAWQESLRPIC